MIVIRGKFVIYRTNWMLVQICTVPIQRKRNAIMAWIAREKEPLKSIRSETN